MRPYVVVNGELRPHPRWYSRKTRVAWRPIDLGDRDEKLQSCKSAAEASSAVSKPDPSVGGH